MGVFFEASQNPHLLGVSAPLSRVFVPSHSGVRGKQTICCPRWRCHMKSIVGVARHMHVTRWPRCSYSASCSCYCDTGYLPKLRRLRHRSLLYTLRQVSVPERTGQSPRKCIRVLKRSLSSKDRNEHPGAVLLLLFFRKDDPHIYVANTPVDRFRD